MKNNVKKTVGIYWQHMRKYKFTFFIILFVIIFTAILNSIIPVYFKKFFDVLSESGTPKDEIVKKLLAILLTILIIKTIRWLMGRSNVFLVSIFESNVMMDIKNTCFKYLHKHSFSFFNDNFTGSLVKKVNYFANAFEHIIDAFFFSILGLFVNITVVIYVLSLRNWTLGLIIFLWFVFMITFNILFAKFKFKFDVKKNETESLASGFLSDTTSNHSNVKLFNGYKKEVNDYAKINDKARKLTLFSWNLDTLFEAFQLLFMIFLEVGLFYVGIRLWQKNSFTIGDFVLLQSYVLMVSMKIMQLSWMIRGIYSSFSSAEEMTEILNIPNEIKDAKDAKKLKVVNGEIKFESVDFYYNDTRQILNKLNLEIKAKEKVAFIGPSGAGKSTIVKLLLRNHNLDKGKIIIDGQDISHITQESLWRNIGFVPQDSILFHRSLMDNIRYGKINATDKEVIAAAKLAHCHEFISKFPEKYNTKVGERGVKLSGGERQRVAIARAILKNAPILVLDEATSSLDSESEGLIQDALSELMKNRTVIVIAHRLSTITKMDRIIVIDKGGIKESGTHSELKQKKNGHYKKLWELQAGGFIKE